MCVPDIRRKSKLCYCNARSIRSWLIGLGVHGDKWIVPCKNFKNCFLWNHYWQFWRVGNWTIRHNPCCVDWTKLSRITFSLINSRLGKKFGNAGCNNPILRTWETVCFETDNLCHTALIKRTFDFIVYFLRKGCCVLTFLQFSSSGVISHDRSVQQPEGLKTIQSFWWSTRHNDTVHARWNWNESFR